MNTMNHEMETVEMGSDNVLVDLGFADAEEMSVKTQLAVQIIGTLRARRLTQSAAAQLTGLKQPDISNIVNTRLDGISVERLFLVLNRLGRRIEIRVSAEEMRSEDAKTLVLA